MAPNSKLFTYILAIVLSAGILVGCSDSGKNAEENAKTMTAQAQELLKEQKYDAAIKVYRKIIRENPGSRLAGNAQFMIGFTYANSMNDLEQAKIEFNRFLDSYAAVAESGLIAGAKFELENLGKNVEEIEVISKIGAAEASDEEHATE
ncbi:tetratricopeptide repeat protein [Calditrichota bacterium]